MENDINEYIKDKTEQNTHTETIVSVKRILGSMKKKSYSPWIDTHIKLKTAAMIYQLKLKLIGEGKWDQLANPRPYREYEGIAKKVEQFTKRVTELLLKKEKHKLSQSQVSIQAEGS